MGREDGRLGFPSQAARLDMVRAMAQRLSDRVAADDDLDEESSKLGKNWTAYFLERQPSLATKYSTQLDRQRAKASKPATIRDYFPRMTVQQSHISARRYLQHR